MDTTGTLNVTAAANDQILPTPRRGLLRSIGAVFAGLFAIFFLSTATDMVLHATGVYPPMAR